MSGEHEQRQDDFEEAEHAFILEDWEELDEVLADVEEEAAPAPGTRTDDGSGSPADAAGAEPGEGETAEDILFGPTGADTSPRRAQFDEHGNAAWGGHTLTAAELGLPVDEPDEPALAPEDVFEIDFEPGDGEYHGDSGFFDSIGSPAESPDLFGDDLGEQVVLTDDDGQGYEADPLDDEAIGADPSGLGEETADDDAWLDPAAELDAPHADEEDPFAPIGDATEEVQEVPLESDGMDDFQGESGFFGAASESEWEGETHAYADDTQGADDVDGQEFAAPEGDLTEDAWADEVDGEYGDAEGDEALDGEYAEGEYADDEYADGEYADAESDEPVPDFPDYDDPYVAAPTWQPDEEHGSRRLWGVAALAAVLLVSVGAGTLFLKPEWLGLGGPAVHIERVDVARPALDLELPEPPVDLADAAPVAGGGSDPSDPTDPGTGDPGAVRPVGHDPLTTEPPTLPPTGADPGHQPPVSDPTQVQPPVGNPGALQPTNTDPVVAINPVQPSVPLAKPPAVDPNLIVVHPPSSQRRQPAEELIEVGEELRVGERAEMAPRPPAEAAPLAGATDLVAGDQAFAELSNGNYFVGNLKAVRGDDLTLSVDRGEVTLLVEELRSVGSVQSPEFAKLRRSRPGFIRLTNQNRLRGSIVSMGDGNSVALDLQSSRIVIPESAIQEITADQPAGVRVNADDDAWIRQLVERRIEQTGSQPTQK
ncbi:MAG: hypothetical protein AAF628_17970 [Planctomycetota bacterium]